MTEPHLRIVDSETGEIHDTCPNCEGADKEVRAWRTRYARLKKDRDKDARGSEYWPLAGRIFRYWTRSVNRKNCVFTTDRFELIMPMLKRDEAELCMRAIAGGIYDPYQTSRRNGTIRSHNDWEQIFANTGRRDEFAARAPTDWKPPKGFNEAIREIKYGRKLT